MGSDLRKGQMKCKAFPLFKTINKVFSIWDLVTLVNGYCTLKDFLQKGKPLLALRILTGPQSLISATKVCSSSRVNDERVSRAQKFTLSWNLGICSSYMFMNKQTFQYITTNLNITKSYTKM